MHMVHDCVDAFFVQLETQPEGGYWYLRIIGIAGFQIGVWVQLCHIRRGGPKLNMLASCVRHGLEVAKANPDAGYDYAMAISVVSRLFYFSRRMNQLGSCSYWRHQEPAHRKRMAGSFT